jgi:hypothetical protein
MPVLETLALIGAISGGATGLAGTIGGLIGGAKAQKEAEKAQTYQEKWTDRLYGDEMRQQAFQNTLATESAALSKAAQRFNQELALRNEARTDTDRWHTTMQNAANKYADILNRSKELQRSNAAALQNR